MILSDLKENHQTLLIVWFVFIRKKWSKDLDHRLPYFSHL